jgi:hypothetical protein
VLAVALSATGGKCDGYLGHRARQVQWVVMRRLRDADPQPVPVRALRYTEHVCSQYTPTCDFPRQSEPIRPVAATPPRLIVAIPQDRACDPGRIRPDHRLRQN